jgi:sugar lactone lactonase YvrE
MTIIDKPPESVASGTEALVEEARRRQRHRRRWTIGLVVIAIVAGGGGLLISSGNGGRVADRTVRHHQATVSTPTAPPQTPPSLPLGLDRPEALAIAPDGSLLISNQGTNQILRYLPSNGQFQVVAGNGTKGFSGDGGPAVDAELDDPNGIAVAADGTIYVADTFNNRVRAIAPDGIITTVAGNGTFPGATESGGGTATAVPVGHPFAVAVGAQGNLYIADDSVGVQLVSPEGIISTDIPEGPGTFYDPDGLAIDSSGDLYVAAFSNKAIIEFSPNGTVLQTWVSYVTPAGLAVAPDGSIAVADEGRFAIEQISDGRLVPIATFSLDSVPGMTGTFRPSGVAVSPTGETYAISDGVNGGTNTPALLAIDPGGQVHVLDTGDSS